MECEYFSSDICQWNVVSAKSCMYKSCIFASGKRRRPTAWRITQGQHTPTGLFAYRVEDLSYLRELAKLYRPMVGSNTQGLHVQAMVFVHWLTDIGLGLCTIERLHRPITWTISQGRLYQSWHVPINLETLVESFIHRLGDVVQLKA